MRQLIILLLLCCSGSLIYGQTLKQYLKEADLSFDEHQDYYNAMRFYNKALTFCPADSLRIMYRAAESADRAGVYNHAISNYNKVIQYDGDNMYPDATLYLGQIYQHQSNYNKALEYYRLYKSENDGADHYNQALYDRLVSSCNYALSSTTDPCVYQDITITRAADYINTAHHEFAPVIEPGQNTVSYSSMQFQPEDCCKKDFPYTIGKILKSEEGSAPGLYHQQIDKGNVTVSHLVYNSDRSKIYYTICDNINTLVQRCDIYSRSIQAGDILDDELKLPAPINQEDHTSTHPNIGLIDGQEVLFFASDRPGTKGGLDLWYANLNGDGSFTDPTNISDLNTTSDDGTPFYHKGTELLYFSSRGYSDAYGGYDMRRSAISATASRVLSFGGSINLGNNWNSGYDDFYYVASDDEKTAWFSSNRPSTNSLDTTACAYCYDLFKVDITPEDPIYLVIAADGCGVNIRDAMITVTNMQTGEQIASSSSQSGYQVKKCHQYRVTVNAPGFAQNTVEIDIPQNNTQPTISRTIPLETQRVQLTIRTWESGCDSGNYSDGLAGLDVVAKNLSKPNLPDLLRRSETNNEVIIDNLVPNDQYVITTIVNNCTFIDTIVANPNGPDCAVTLDYCCIDELEDCKPCIGSFKLYFDNDSPDPRTTNTYSSVDYSESYVKYTSEENRQSFREGYARCSGSKDVTQSGYEIDNWFGTVESQYRALREVVYCMPEWIEAHPNESVVFNLYGNASSNHESDYNSKLSARRIDAVQKMLNGWLSELGLPPNRVIVIPQQKGESDCTSAESGPCAVYDPVASECRNVLVKVACRPYVPPTSCNLCQWGDVVNLYFDQNEPRTSSLSYDQYHQRYDTPKRRREYIDGLTLCRQELCRDTTCSTSTTAGWFGLVQLELDKMNNLLECLPDHLDNYGKVKITLEGYDNYSSASYNSDGLVNRRISTVRNMLRDLESKYGDRIVIETKSFGSEDCQPAYRTFYKDEYDNCDVKNRSNCLIYHPDEFNCRKVRVLIECIN